MFTFVPMEYFLESFLYLRRISFWTNKKLKKGSSLYLQCRDPGSNQGPLDLQSNALPTLLSRLVDIYFCSRGVFSQIISLSLWNPILDQQISEKEVLCSTSNAATRYRTRDLWIFSLTLSQLSYHGLLMFTFVPMEYFLESFLYLRRISFWTNKKLKKGSSLYLQCRDPGSNQGPLDLQSNALPTLLSRLVDVYFCSRGVFSQIISLSLWNPILDQQISEKEVLCSTSIAATRYRTRDLWIFSLTLSQLRYHCLLMFTFVLVEYCLESFLYLRRISFWTNKMLNKGSSLYL